MNSSSNPHPWIGRCFGDNQRYRIDKRLGGGGMGDVFLVTDTRIGQQVALKLLKNTLLESTEMRQRFEREVTISAALPSEHIVKVSDCGVTPEGYPFYIMEYLRGESLGDLLRREGRLTIDRTVKIISQVCNGLIPAHQGVTLPSGEHIQEVVHRDLKPDNIFLVPTDLGDWVKIVDFGIAKIRDEHHEQLTLANTFLGTLRYSAPEQMMGDKNLDARADIYSLGVMMYEMLSGADPFGFNPESHQISEASWIIAHATEQPKSLRSKPGCEQLPPELEAIVMRCLAKDPPQRFSSVVELNRALQALATDVTAEPDRTTVQPRPNLSGDLAPTSSPLSNEPIHPTPAETIRKPPRLPQPEQREEPAAKVTIHRTSIQPHPDLAGFSGEIESPSSPASTAEVSIDPVDPSAVAPISHPSEPWRSGQTNAPVGANPPTLPEQTIVQPREFHPESIDRSVAPPQPANRSGLWVKLGAGAVISLGLAGGIYTYLHQPGAVLAEISSLKQQANYPQCIAKAEEVPANATSFDRVQEILNECRLAYAIDLKAKGRLVEAIDTAKKIPQSSHLYQQAQKYLEDWTTL
jgi:eukaryotic-like serine/threonine-protein kinase